MTVFFIGAGLGSALRIARSDSDRVTGSGEPSGKTGAERAGAPQNGNFTGIHLCASS